MLAPTWEFWARQFLKQQGLPCDYAGENMVAVLSWMRTENTRAQWNPLATTLVLKGLPGHIDSWVLPNSIANVQQYATFGDGLFACVKTLHDGLSTPEFGYQAIINSLKVQNKAETTCAAVHASAWGTQILNSTVAEVRSDYHGVYGVKQLLTVFPA